MFGMGTGVAPPLSPPEFSVRPAPAGRRREAYSILELVMPCQAYSRNRYRPTRPQPANTRTAANHPRAQTARQASHAGLAPRIHRSARGRCPHYQVPGRGSGHSEHRPKPAGTEVSPSARPQPGNTVVLESTTVSAHVKSSPFKAALSPSIIVFNYHDNCFEGIDQQASQNPRCIIGMATEVALPPQRMIALVKSLGLLVLLG